MAVEKETQLEAWLEENMPEPGGGNPNYVENITGDSENPWGTYTFAQLCDLADSKAATFILEMSVYNDDNESDDIYRFYYQGSRNLLMGWLVYSQEKETNWASQVDMVANKNFGIHPTSAGHIRTIKPTLGTNINIPWQTLPAPTTLTIIHHPLPDNQ